MNEDPILSPAQNYRLSNDRGCYCEWVYKDEYLMICRRPGIRINSETFRCPEHLPIAFES